MSLIEAQKEMRSEWEAWQKVVGAWNEADLPDFNGAKATPVIKAIERWGEALVELRIKLREKEKTDGS